LKSPVLLDRAFFLWPVVVEWECSRKTPFWQEEYFDRIVRDEKEFLDKAQYILNHPLKRWPEMEKYPWVWVKQDLIASGGRLARR
jgi:hypothetical protein